MSDQEMAAKIRETHPEISGSESEIEDDDESMEAEQDEESSEEELSE